MLEYWRRPSKLLRIKPMSNFWLCNFHKHWNNFQNSLSKLNTNVNISTGFVVAALTIELELKNWINFPKNWLKTSPKHHYFYPFCCHSFHRWPIAQGCWSPDRQLPPCWQTRSTVLGRLCSWRTPPCWPGHSFAVSSFSRISGPWQLKNNLQIV